MKSAKHSVTAHDAVELADALGLGNEDAFAMEFRAKLNKKIVDLAAARQVTHAELASKTKASRTRITAILNGQTQGVSTDFLLRILYALGYRTNPTFSKIPSAA